MKDANKLNVQYVIIIGDDEIKNNHVVIKNMDSGEQVNIAINEINKYFNQ